MPLLYLGRRLLTKNNIDNRWLMRFPVDIGGLAELILSPKCRSVVLLTGAGVSCASGIPDFRSPGGMYDTLQPKLITATESERDAMRQDPTAVVEKSMFLQNAFPYLEVRRPFILGTQERRWKATIAHHFAELLHTRTGKLTRVYTQNIDGLDFQCERLPPDKIVSVHGTIGRAACETCGAPADFKAFCDDVKRFIKDIYGKDSDAPSQSSQILCRACSRPTVKPATVLFGGAMPREFSDHLQDDMLSVDVLIVAGTSLVVSPANFLVNMAPPTASRVIVNKEPVGIELGIEYGSESSGRDLFAQGTCDEVFLELISHLGWTDALQEVSHELPEASTDLLRFFYPTKPLARIQHDALP